MKISRTLPVALLLQGLILSTLPATRAQQPDNSAENQTQSTYPNTQSSAKSDLMLTRQARKAIVADKELSMYAHNVKIIARDGSLTLKGPVKSDDEKQKVATDVASVVGADKISNQLTVKP